MEPVRYYRINQTIAAHNMIVLTPSRSYSWCRTSPLEDGTTIFRIAKRRWRVQMRSLLLGARSANGPGSDPLAMYGAAARFQLPEKRCRQAAAAGGRSLCLEQLQLNRLPSDAGTYAKLDKSLKRNNRGGAAGGSLETF